ncbi:MAG: hypothetical protein ACYC27_20580 [Armatimonadota bacterium]
METNARFYVSDSSINELNSVYNEFVEALTEFCNKDGGDISNTATMALIKVESNLRKVTEKLRDSIEELKTEIVAREQFYALEKKKAEEARTIEVLTDIWFDNTAGTITLGKTKLSIDADGRIERLDKPHTDQN